MERICPLLTGEPDIVIKHFETSLRLSPLGPRWTQTTGIGIGHMFCGRLDAAASFLQLALQENPSYPLANRFLLRATPTWAGWMTHDKW